VQGNRRHPGAPPVWVSYGGVWVTDLRGHCVQAHIPGVFRDLVRTGEDIGRVRASALQTILRGSGGTCLVTWQDY
jgi:hypothetical protein